MQPLDVDVLLVRPADAPFQVEASEDRGWGKLVRDVEVCYVPGHHHSMVQMPQARQLARQIQTALSAEKKQKGVRRQ
jgi:thioesterase domain-containing protein